MDLAGLGHAIAVAREGSFSAAAEALGVSQSAISRSIQALESLYDTRLFERAKLGTKLTKDGAAFLKIAEDIVRRAHLANDQLRRVPSGGTAPVRMGVGPLIAATLLPRLLPKLIAEGTQIEVNVASSRALQLELQQGMLDFCICAISRLEYLYAANDFEVHRVTPGSFGLIVRDGHPILAEGATPQNLAKYPTASGSFLRDSVAPFSFDYYGLQLPSVEVDDYNLLVELAVQTDIIIIANRLLAHTHRQKGVTSLPLAITAGEHADVVVISLKDGLSSKAKRAIEVSAEYADTMMEVVNSG